MSTTNVIDVTFGNDTLVFVQNVTSQRYQYNEGIYLNFTDLDLPTAWTTEFCNEGVAPVYSMVGSGTQVEIPVDVMDNGKAIYCYVMDTSIEDTVITKAEVRIPPIKRAPRPDGTEPTPSQQTLVEQALTALNSAVDACEEAVEQTESNVTHYPKIEDGTWRVWDAENSAWVDTGITAEGQDGKGIASIAKTSTVGLVDTYTITFTDGTTTTFTVTNGADGDDYVLTAQDKTEIASMITAPVDDVQINGTSILSSGVANIPIATSSTNGAMSAEQASHLDAVYADYSSALTALGVIE